MISDHGYVAGDPLKDQCAECGASRLLHVTDQPLNDSDYALAPPPEPAKALRPEEILRLGALTLQQEQSEAIEELLTEQEQTYRKILKEQGPGPLIEALLARDRQLAYTGRQVADRRTQSRMMREFIRGLLQLADYRSLRAVGDATKTGQIERVLEALGAEPADLRQLKLHGSTLGELESGEQRAGELSSGTRKS